MIGRLSASFSSRKRTGKDRSEPIRTTSCHDYSDRCHCWRSLPAMQQLIEKKLAAPTQAKDKEDKFCLQPASRRPIYYFHVVQSARIFGKHLYRPSIFDY